MTMVQKNKKRILVVDDEELLTRTFTMLLEKNGYEVYTAKNGCDAQVMAEEEVFDLILCDIRMPGKNGVETIKSIQNFLATNQRHLTPVIFITGFADEKLQEEAMKLKPLAYIMKPFDLQELMGIIEKAI